MSGTLFLVATPIGNLGDMTFRAVETLRAVALIVAEDTRRARILCEHFGVRTPLRSMPAFSEADRAGSVVERLIQGDDVALITDAGSPGISDPGSLLVEKAVEAKICVTPIPGPSAVVAALSASGLPTARFHFVGFLPRKGVARTRVLDDLKSMKATLVIYESPERLAATLKDLESSLGNRRAVVARELTKLHEAFSRGRLTELTQQFEAGTKGEVTLMVEGRTEDEVPCFSEVTLAAEIKHRLRARETSLKDIAQDLADTTGRRRQEIYALALRIKANLEDI